MPEATPDITSSAPTTTQLPQYTICTTLYLDIAAFQRGQFLYWTITCSSNSLQKVLLTVEAEDRHDESVRSINQHWLSLDPQNRLTAMISS